MTASSPFFRRWDRVSTGWSWSTFTPFEIDVLPPLRSALARRLQGGTSPAIGVVVTALPVADALMAVDVVAVAPTIPAGGEVFRTAKRGRGQAKVAVLPAGSRVYVSGQADAAENLALATRSTLKGLVRTLDHLGLDRSRIVQLKVFFQPMASVAEVEREIARFFEPATVPPLVFVEWRSSREQPIEIELIAANPKVEGREPVEFVTPPGLKPSPLFSRVAKVNRGDLVYVSGLQGPAGTTGAEQVQAIFESLEKILAMADSDLRHLVKATYYVADEEASRALNELRPRYYDPARPPAASKAVVAGVGAIGRSVSLDMIAVSQPRKGRFAKGPNGSAGHGP